LIDLAAARVILIGGVSGSGKSHYASRLAAELPGHALVRLDWMYNSLVATGARHPRRKMAKLAPAIVAEIIGGGEPAIIDGGWIEPRAWARLAAGRIDCRARFLGYPTTEPKALLARLAATDHWLGAPDAATQGFLRRQIAHSAEQQRRIAGSMVADFIDVSGGFGAR